MTEKKHKKRKHALCSASSSSRWLACPGSIPLSVEVPTPPSSPYAEEGTKAHELSELMLIPLLQDGASWEQATTFHTLQNYPEDMRDYVLAYVRYIYEETQRDKPKKVLIEEKLTLDTELGMYGLADVLYAYRGPRGEKFGRIIDLKYGRGLEVEVEKNSQLAYYAAALQAQYGNNPPFEQITVTIYQPRIEHEEGAARSWTLSKADIAAWADKLKQGATYAISQWEREPHEYELNAGSHCIFCPAKAICGAYVKHVSEEAALDFADAELVEKAEALVESSTAVVPLEDAQVSRILTARDSIRKFLDAVEGYAIARAHDNDPIPGWKLVEGRSMRRFIKDTVIVETTLKQLGLSAEDIFDKKLKTLTSIEKKLKKDKSKLEPILTRTTPGAKLVPESDSRPHFDPSVQARVDFETDLETGDGDFGD